MAVLPAFVLGLNPAMGPSGDDHEDAARALVAYLDNRLSRPASLSNEPTYQAQLVSMASTIPVVTSHIVASALQYRVHNPSSSSGSRSSVPGALLA